MDFTLARTRVSAALYMFDGGIVDQIMGWIGEQSLTMIQGSDFWSSSLLFVQWFVQIILCQEEVKMAEPVKEEKKPTETPETKGWLYKWTNYIKVKEWNSQHLVASFFSPLIL